MSVSKNIQVKEMPTIEKELPTTQAQMAVWLASQYGDSRDGRCQNEFASLKLHGNLSVRILQNAFLMVIERHDGMRSISSADGKNLIVFKSYKVPIRMRDIREMGSIEKDLFVKKHTDQKGHYHFNLVQGPLYVLDLIQLEENDYLLTLTGQQLVFDEESIQIRLGELAALYSELVSSKISDKYESIEEDTHDYFNFNDNSSYTNNDDSWQIYLSNPAQGHDSFMDASIQELLNGSKVSKKL
jgi:hypothetical protein